MGFIYVIRNTVNDKMYVGQTTRTVEARWYRTVWEGGGTSNRPIYRAIRKYGKDKFELYTVEECSDEKLNEREIYWIAELDTLVPNGYNLQAGGQAVGKMHEETKDKLRAVWGTTDDKIRKISELYKQGYGCKEIARRLGMTRWTVSKYIRREEQK